MINIITIGDSYFPARFCGVDTPKVSYNIQKKGEPDPEKQEWKQIEEFKEVVSQELINKHLEKILDNKEAAYHHQKHADNARNELKTYSAIQILQNTKSYHEK